MPQHVYEPKTRYEPLGAVEVVRNGHNPLGGTSEWGWKGELERGVGFTMACQRNVGFLLEDTVRFKGFKQER